jgi:hypothetical protein
MPDRRKVLVGLAFALGGPLAAASCGGDEDAILRALRPDGRLQFHRRGEYRLIGLIADAIIPRTDTPGAIDAGVPAYLDAMMASWASDETKTAHRDQLRLIEARLEAIGAGDFAKLEDGPRRDAVAALDADAFDADPDSEVSRGYRQLKSLIASIYYTSEPGATEELHYLLAPGPWVADAPLSDIGKTWAE